MRKISSIAALVLFPLMATAAEAPYLFDFVQGKETGKAYSKLIARENLPDWVKRGGTSTPASEVTINGQKYLALSGCKPHNCPAESIAILYSPDKGDIHGVYSEYDASSDKQTLKWMNLDPIESVEMRNVLFNTLGGN